MISSDFERKSHCLESDSCLGSASMGIGKTTSLQKWTKRAFDILFSVAALISFGVPLLVISVILKVVMGGPVIFAHRRVGLGGQHFSCLKFRTMYVDADERLADILATDPEAAAEFAETQKLRNDPRIIPYVGHFLRKTSLDEMPQFINVLLGHMSIVGPRPVTQKEWVQYYGVHHGYSKTRPGITGLWQISGRNDVGYGERVKLDEAYITNWSFAQDIQIILRTISVVFIDRNGC